MLERAGLAFRCTATRRLLAMAVAMLTTVTLLACDGGGGDPVGTWVIDKEATRVAWEAHVKPGGETAENLERFDLMMVLKVDGTIEASLPTPGGKPAFAQGTWNLVGANVFLTIEGDDAIGRFQGNRLVVEEQAGNDPPMVLKRK